MRKGSANEKAFVEVVSYRISRPSQGEISLVRPPELCRVPSAGLAVAHYIKMSEVSQLKLIGNLRNRQNRVIEKEKESFTHPKASKPMHSLT